MYQLLKNIYFSLVTLGIIYLTNVECIADSKDVSSSTYYFLFTRHNIDHYYLLKLGDSANLAVSPFDDSLRVYVIIHGWHDNGQTDWVMTVKDSILSVDDANVISVEWSYYADVVQYEDVVDDMYEVANLTTYFIDWLISSTAVNPSDFHLIGHDLGAHCSGLAAKDVATGLIDRVTGLDPAGPLFNHARPSERIDKSNAKLVDIIHTNACTPAATCMGLIPAVGDIDFFPNGGQYQPGCVVSACQHDRAHEFFIESITAGEAFGTDAFVAWPCADWDTFENGSCSSCGDGCPEMGFYVDGSLTGDYYLRTETYSPYAKGDNQTIY